MACIYTEVPLKQMEGIRYGAEEHLPSDLACNGIVVVKGYYFRRCEFDLPKCEIIFVDCVFEDCKGAYDLPTNIRNV